MITKPLKFDKLFRKESASRVSLLNFYQKDDVQPTWNETKPFHDSIEPLKISHTSNTRDRGLLVISKE